MVTPAAAARISKNAGTRRRTWLAGIQAIPDPALRAQVARAELEAATSALRATADAAMAELHAAIGGEEGGGWAEVGRRVPNPTTGRPLSRPVARRHGLRGQAHPQAEAEAS